MRATATASTPRNGKRRLLESCAIAAGLTALAHGGPALAQVNANPVFVDVGVGTSVSNSGTTNSTTVNVTQDQSIINWVPTDTAPTGGAIDLLPTGENWNFIGTGDYTVLNRFVNGGGGSLSREIALNGTVNSYVGSTTGPRGGNIWFYNAGGILIGATGVINVGSLVLTTNDVITTGGLFGAGGEIRFDGTAGSTSAITVNGAINANKVGNPGGSYVALIAPRVVQAGAVRVDGSAAYVAAEQVDIRINGGLFDINVTRGVEGGNAITHSGTTTGPAHQDGDTDQNRIYMVAIPKNDAVTMLVSGAIGYDDAVSATEADGAVRLSAGYNVVGGELATAPVNATAANITAGDTLFRSDTIAHASNVFAAQPTQPLPGSPPPLSSAGQFFVEGNGTFIGDASATVSIGANQSGGATDTFTVQSNGRGAASGNAAVNITGGTFSVPGALTIEASGTADAMTGDSQGGTANLTITGGILSGGVIELSADGFSNGDGDGANGRGGTATFTQTGGDVSISDMRISADGVGGTATGLSGTGTGGVATIDLSGGTITAADIIASASGEGGFGSDGTDEDPANIVAGGTGGGGVGGDVAINIGGSAVVDASVIAAYANGSGGSGGSFFNASSFGGVPGTPGNGGDGSGGSARVNLGGGSVTASSVIADATGIGGEGGTSFFSSSSGGATGIGVGGTGGTGRGGDATIGLSAATGAIADVSALAQGIGGAGGSHNVGGAGGNALGGVAQAIIDDFDAGTLDITLDSTAQGGNGASGNDGRGGNGGNAVGGSSSAVADGANAVVRVTQANFVTGANGGNGGDGNLGFGSSAAVAPSGGNGGTGQGGAAEVIARAGATMTLGLASGDVVELGSTGTGGNGGNGASADFGEGNFGGDGGVGGSGVGGSVRMIADGGTITTAGESLEINVSGQSGSGGNGGLAGGGGSLPGSNAGFFGTVGGRVNIDALAAETGPGLVDLGNASIFASGDVAGRVEIRTDSRIDFASLEVEVRGLADPTNNDTDEAPEGVFLSASGGTIETGSLSVITDGSIGLYAQGGGQVVVGQAAQLLAGDQIDIRHDQRGDNAAPTLRVADDLAIVAGTSVSGAAGSLLSAGGTLSLTGEGPGATIGVDALDAADIVINSSGAASVEHAEAINDFTATTGSFRTGVNSIITGGDISITSPGAVDLGNSTAGGFVQVDGQSIVFNNIDAGMSVNLFANGTAAGSEGIRGGSIAAGGDITLFANSIDLTGTVTGDASFFAFGTGGAVSVNAADVGGTISVFAENDLTGTFVAGGNIFLNSNGNIAASGQANGGYIDANGFAAEGNLFVVAAGNATLTNSRAGRMFGVSAGTSASVTGGTAGEDILILAGTTASLTDVTGGDDITVNAPGDITALNVRTTGAGADTHILSFSSASGSPTFTIGMGEGTEGINGADIVMASATGAIDAGTLSAGDDILLNAANSIAVNGATTLGLGTTGGDSSIRTQGGGTTLGNINAFSDVIVQANGAAALDAAVAAGRDVSITAASVSLATLANPAGAAIDTLTADGNIVVISTASINGGGTQAFGDVTLQSGDVIDVTSVGGASVTLSGDAGITAGQVSSSATTSVDSIGGDILIAGLNSSGTIAASANAIRIESGGNQHFTTLTTLVGDAYVRGNGDFSVASGTVAGTADFGTSGEAMNIIALTAANANIANGGGFLNLDTIDVTGSLNASAQSTLNVTGIVTGQAISLASADIAIAPDARVGTAGVTQQLSVANNNSDNQTFVGGSGTPDGYHLSADEMTRLYGTQIEIFAPEVEAAGDASIGSAAPPDVIIDGFTVTGGAAGSNLGANGALTIRTPGKMRVIGNAQLTGLTDDNALNLIGEDALEVILGQGTVRLVNGSNPAGQLNLFSDDVIVATPAAITAVGAATTIDAINSRLGENDGVTIDEGALFAGGIRATVSGGFYVQNSGAGTDLGQRRGLTFGALGLDVAALSPSARIVINGVQLGSAGQVTGLDVIPSLTVNGSAPTAGSFDPRSTFNGCFITNSGACTTVTVDFENSFPVQDLIEEEVDAEDEGADGEGSSLPVPLITMRELDPLTGEPLLDDPVTGAGNDDLWTAPTDTP